MKYRLKSDAEYIVKAMKFSEDTPTWERKRFIDEHPEIEIDHEGIMRINTGVSYVHVKNDDWIVIHEGHTYVVRDKQFEMLYEVVRE